MADPDQLEELAGRLDEKAGSVREKNAQFATRVTNCNWLSDGAERLAVELAHDLEAIGKYTRVEVAYADDTTNTRKLGISIYCTSCDPTAAFEAGMEAAWQSRIAPVRTLRVSATNTETLKDKSRYVSVEDAEKKMNRKYGERPVLSVPEA